MSILAETTTGRPKRATPSITLSSLIRLNMLTTSLKTTSVETSSMAQAFGMLTINTKAFSTASVDTSPTEFAGTVQHQTPSACITQLPLPRPPCACNPSSSSLVRLPLPRGSFAVNGLLQAGMSSHSTRYDSSEIVPARINCLRAHDAEKHKVCSVVIRLVLLCPGQLLELFNSEAQPAIDNLPLNGAVALRCISLRPTASQFFCFFTALHYFAHCFTLLVKLNCEKRN